MLCGGGVLPPHKRRLYIITRHAEKPRVYPVVGIVKLLLLVTEVAPALVPSSADSPQCTCELSRGSRDQAIRYYADVYAGLQQVHSCCMPTMSFKT